MKDINQELEKLLRIKTELDKIMELKKTVPTLLVVSQLMYDHLSSKNLLNPNTLYYVTSVEVGQYIEGFRG